MKNFLVYAIVGLIALMGAAGMIMLTALIFGGLIWLFWNYVLICVFTTLPAISIFQACIIGLFLNIIVRR